MKRIPLTQGKYAIVDDEDYKWLSQWKWCVQSQGRLSYAIRSVKEDGKNHTVRMHREVMKLHRYDKRQVDHINGNGLDNRKSNLRLCNQSQNSQNQHSQNRKSNTSRYKGVYLMSNIVKGKRYSYWYASIRVNRKLISLGSYNNQIDAACAYDEAAIKYFGEFARLNFKRKGA